MPALPVPFPPADAFVVKKLRDAGCNFALEKGQFEPNSHRVAAAWQAPATLRSLKLALFHRDLSSIGRTNTQPPRSWPQPCWVQQRHGCGGRSGFTQFGLGTDDRGSVRNPSSANGVVGLRPTLVSSAAVVSYLFHHTGHGRTNCPQCLRHCGCIGCYGGRRSSR